MGYYLILNENLHDGGRTWRYFTKDDYQVGVMNKKWGLWKKMFSFYHPVAHVFTTEAEAKDVMRCLGNFAPFLRRKMQVLSKEHVDQTLIQKVLFSS
jgi:hypothetical protein